MKPWTFIKGYFFPLLLLVVGILVFSQKEELFDIINVMANIKPHWLAVAAFFQFITYAAESRAYNSILKTWKRRVETLPMIRRLIIGRFIGRTVPSLSIAGNVYIAKKLHDDGFSKNVVIQTILKITANYYLAILVFAVLSYVFLWVTERLTVLEVVFFGVFTLLAAFLFLLNYFGARRHGRLGAYYEKIMDKFTAAAHKLFGFQEEDSKEDRHGNDARENRYPYTTPPPVFIPMAFFWEIARFLSDSITVFFIFLGFGATVQFSIVTVGFAVATIFGMISIFPGGLGQFEAAQILTYTSLGIPVQLAIAVTLVYRLLSFWLPIPIGALLYKKEGKKSILRTAR